MAPLVLAILTFTGKHNPMIDLFPDLQEILQRVCLELISLGTAKQAKAAIKCLFSNVSTNQGMTFSLILDVIKNKLDGRMDQGFLTAIVSLGHLAFHSPDSFSLQLKKLVSKKFVKEVMMKEATPARVGDSSWCSFHDLCIETQIKVEGIKMMARWLLGLKTNESSAKKTLKLLNAIIENGGDLLEEGRQSPAEKAWLRLSAGCAVLKICEEKGLGNQLSREQYCTVSGLMRDPVVCVRERFIIKLHKGLSRGVPLFGLSPDFMGLYVLAGLEMEPRLHQLANQFMVIDINTRREYMKTLSCDSSSLVAHIMPDYMLATAVLLLTHQSNFTSSLDVEHLKKIKLCLLFILEPLTGSNSYCSKFYLELLEKIRNHGDGSQGENNLVTLRLWAVCDLALGIIKAKPSNKEANQFVSSVRLPRLYTETVADSNPDSDKSDQAEIQQTAVQPITASCMDTVWIPLADNGHMDNLDGTSTIMEVDVV